MSAEKKAKRPTHDVCVKMRDPQARGGVVGAAWLNEDGTVSVQLNPCVVIAADALERVTLFPRGA